MRGATRLASLHSFGLTHLESFVLLSRPGLNVALLLPSILLSACSTPPNNTDEAVLSIGAIPSGEYESFSQYFSKHVSVFGVNIFASGSTADDKVLHAAHVLAQYLDNDEDGVVADGAVLAEMTGQEGGANLLMFADEDELESSGLFESDLLDSFRGQDLLGDETHPEGSSASGGFDATLEEVWHLVSSKGHSGLRPDVFGEQVGSALAEAMDLARGGHFQNIPQSYPDTAWYHYDDPTCEYQCQVAEYFYWALTSILGAQNYSGRCDEIAVEWELCTREQVEIGDVAVFELLTDTSYRLPTVLPDGSYQDD